MTLGQRFADACALWALEEGGLTFVEPERATRFVLDNWSELSEACEIAGGEIRALGEEDEVGMAHVFAVQMLKQAGFKFPNEAR